MLEYLKQITTNDIIFHYSLLLIVFVPWYILDNKGATLGCCMLHKKKVKLLMHKLSSELRMPGYCNNVNEKPSKKLKSPLKLNDLRASC